MSLYLAPDSSLILDISLCRESSTLSANSLMIRISRLIAPSLPISNGNALSGFQIHYFTAKKQRESIFEKVDESKKWTNSKLEG